MQETDLSIPYIYMNSDSSFNETTQQENLDGVSFTKIFGVTVSNVTQCASS